MTKRIKRIISMLLIAAMVLCSVNVPVKAYAAENDKGAFVDAFVVFADLHTDAIDRTKSDLVTDLMRSAKENIGYPVSTVNSAGDSFSVCHDYGDDDRNPRFAKDYGDTDGINQSITSVFGDSVQINYVWSDHDRYADVFYNESTQTPYAEEKTSHFIYGAGPDGIYGNSDDDNYYLYALSMADLAGPKDRYNSNFNSSAERDVTIKNFVETANKLNADKPLFVVSHQPLFERRNDNYYAENWCKAINQVAENRDVGFFFGHNHSHDLVGDYFCGNDGDPNTSDSVRIETTSNDGKDMTLNFSHVCAGYMAPGSNTVSDTTRNNTVLGVIIYENAIEYNSYDINGPYKGSLGENHTVARSHILPRTAYTVSAYDAVVNYETCINNKVSIDRIDTSASEIAQYRSVVNVLDYFTGYRISAQVPDNLKTVTVTLPRTGAVLYNTPAVYRVSENGTLKRMTLDAINDTSVTFTTDTFGSFFIGIDLLGEAPECTADITYTSTVDQTVYVPATSFKNGGRYLIVGEKGANGAKMAYLNNNGTEDVLQVVQKNGELTTANGTYSGDYIELNNENAVWTATLKTDSNSGLTGYLLSNGNYYISSNENNTLGSTTSPLPQVYVNFNSSKNLLVATSGAKPYFYLSTYVKDSVPEHWNWSDSSTSGTSSTRNMWIYEEMTISTAVSSTTHYTIQAPDVVYTPYGGGNTASLDYHLYAGRYCVIPELTENCFSFDVVSDTDNLIKEISSKGVITFNSTKSIPTSDCFVKITCNWEDAPLYKYVRIAANPKFGTCHHAYAAITTKATPDACGYTTNTCVYEGCKHSNLSNLTGYVAQVTPTATPKPESTRSSVDTEEPTVNPAPAQTVYKDKTVYVAVDSFENNGKYLIVGEDNVGGNPIAHVNNGGNEDYAKVVINTDALVTKDATYANGYIEFNNSNAVWTAVKSSSGGYRLKNNGGYLGGEYGNTVMNSSSQAAKVVYDAASQRIRTASGTTMYLYYSTYGDENWKWSSSKDSSTSSRKMLIFKEVTVRVAVSGK